MGSYAYCRRPGCDHAMSKPSARETVENDWRCRAGHWRELIESKDDLIIELAEKLEELTERVNQLTASKNAQAQEA